MLESIQSTTDLKACCAALYESDWARLLLGDSFHPGGLALTERVGTLLGLKPGLRLLDVASGQGSSAIFLAQKFGCEVVGLDYGPESVAKANAQAEMIGLNDLVRFEHGDAEVLPFADKSFDAVLCECAFCTFPDKPTAARELARVLRPGARIGLSDLTRSGPLPEELEGVLAWIACIADALPVEVYKSTLERAGFTIEMVEPHNAALAKLVKEVRTRLMGAELMIKLNKLDFPLADVEQAKQLARLAEEAVQDKKLGYAVIIGQK